MPAVAVMGAIAAGEVGTAFAIICPIEAITGIKEFAIVGTVQGAVGGIGSNAPYAGFWAAELGSVVVEAGGFSSWMGTAGEMASSVSPSAGEVVATADRIGGYTFQSLADGRLPNALEGHRADRAGPRGPLSRDHRHGKRRREQRGPTSSGISRPGEGA